MSIENFHAVMAEVLQEEGGFTNDANDPGNWTSGTVGKGFCYGTKYGISAAEYPHLPIRLLTVPAATEIYRRDWWGKYHFDWLKYPFNEKVFDIAVNIGAKRAIEILQLTMRQHGSSVVIDGVIGVQTIHEVATWSEEELLKDFIANVETHYKTVAQENPHMQEYLKGWLVRAHAVPPAPAKDGEVS